VVVGAVDYSSGLFQLLLELERVALESEIEVANGKAGEDIADGAAREVDVETCSAREVLYQGDAAHLVGRQAAFEGVDVICHSLVCKRSGSCLQPLRP